MSSINFSCKHLGCEPGHSVIEASTAYADHHSVNMALHITTLTSVPASQHHTNAILIDRAARMFDVVSGELLPNGVHRLEVRCANRWQSRCCLDERMRFVIIRMYNTRK